MAYVINSRATEAQTRRDIEREFNRWREGHRLKGEPLVTASDYPAPDDIGGCEALVRFVLRGQSLEVRCTNQPTYRLNLRAVFFAIEAMRLNEKRGIGETLRDAYLQLAAPAAGRDPYELLGVRSDMRLEDVEAVYKRVAKRVHSDTGGNDAAMKEVNEAMERIRRDHADK